MYLLYFSSSEGRGGSANVWGRCEAERQGDDLKLKNTQDYPRNAHHMLEVCACRA